MASVSFVSLYGIALDFAVSISPSKAAAPYAMAGGA